MADTDFASLPSTNTIAASDQLAIVRVGIPYRFSGTLPVVDASGNVGIGTTVPLAKLVVSAGGAAGIESFPGFVAGVNLTQHYNRSSPGFVANRQNALRHEFLCEGTEAARIDGGNLLVGVTSGSTHSVVRGSAQGDFLFNVSGNANPSARFYSAGSTLGNAAATALAVSANSSTARSINAAGTINASGADYAEYMRKADGCGDIAKGAVCGVDPDGRLTKSWAASHSFVIKSTDPAYVGGDRWDRHLPPKPEAPLPLGSAPIEPNAPEPFDQAMPLPQEGQNADEYAAAVAIWHVELTAANERFDVFDAALAEFETAHAAWLSDQAAHTAAAAAFEIALPLWEAEYEAARQTVDRIAFSGQVPVIVDGDFAVGDYVIAAASGGGIKAIAVAAADITFDQYRSRLGKVWMVTEQDPPSELLPDGTRQWPEGRWPAGRAWVDVQHG